MKISRLADLIHIDTHLGACRLDSDGDGLTNRTERILGLDKNNPDSDGDGVGDLTELLMNTDHDLLEYEINLPIILKE